MSDNPYDEIMRWPDDLKPDDTQQRILKELKKELQKQTEDSRREAEAAARRANLALAVAIVSLLTTAVIGVLQLLH